MRLKNACNAALVYAVYAVYVASSARADTAADLAACADERVKTAMLPIEQLADAEISCTRVLEDTTSDPDRQKAAFFRGLMRFLQVMQAGMALDANADGSMQEYKLPTQKDVAAALTDVQTAIDLEGPLKGEALALRVTINQTIGQPDGVVGDIEAAMLAAPADATPFVQRRWRLNAGVIWLPRSPTLIRPSRRTHVPGLR